MIYGRELPGYPYNLKAKLTRCIVWGQRQLFGRVLHNFSDHAPLSPDYKGQEANDAVRHLLEKDAPCLVARFGSGEMETTLRGLDVQASGGFLRKFARMCVGKSGPFWWDNSIRAGIVWIAGYFPETDEALNRFANRAVADSSELDILASWLVGEKRLRKAYFPNVKAIPLNDLTPFCFKNPWMGALKGRKVLVVHPFVDTIRQQYARRRDLFADPEALPDFDLITYRSVQSAIGLPTPYKTWFDALDKMCDDIAKVDFDVALIGCGAYGMSIGAFVKRELKRKAVHLGGISQMIFGIKGRRWDAQPEFARYYNEFWSRPLDHERPENFMATENGGYW